MAEILKSGLAVHLHTVKNEGFEELARSTMDEILSWNPITATHTGWHKYDSLLPDPRSEGRHAKLSRISEMLRSFKVFPEENLNENERLDRDLALYALGLMRFELEELRFHEHESLACEEIGGALFHLVAKEFAPFEKRLESAVSRLEAAPRFLEMSREALKSPYRRWNEISLENGRQLPDFVNSIVKIAEEKVADRDLLARLRRAAGPAIDAIAEHNLWLEEDVIPSALGQDVVDLETFRRLLELKGFGVTLEEAVRIAEAHLEAARARRKKIAEEIVASGDASDAIAVVRGNRPRDFAEVLRCYRERVEESKDFVSRKGLMTIPENEKLRVIETPNFMRREAPFAAQYEPGKFDGNQTGLFLVTPFEGNERALEDHNFAAITNTAVHEGYPGHHLQGICANLNPSYVRVLVQSPDFGEGWGLYCEDLMISQGFRDSPQERFVQVNDLIYRILRVIADVKLATREMTVEDVAEMLYRGTGVSKSAALDEANSYCRAPTYILSYFIGKLHLLQLRRDVESALGHRFSQRFFHDSLLYSGTLPMSFMRRAVDIRLREKWGVQLQSPKESFLEFALEAARRGIS